MTAQSPLLFRLLVEDLHEEWRARSEVALQFAKTHLTELDVTRLRQDWAALQSEVGKTVQSFYTVGVNVRQWDPDLQQEVVVIQQPRTDAEIVKALRSVRNYLASAHQRVVQLLEHRVTDEEYVRDRKRQCAAFGTAPGMCDKPCAVQRGVFSSQCVYKSPTSADSVRAQLRSAGSSPAQRRLCSRCRDRRLRKHF